MSYLRQAFRDLYEQDGLLVMGRGLGLRHVLVKFIRYYCDHIASSGGGTPSAGKRRLVFVINAKGEEDLLVDAVAADGVPPHLLPQVLTNEFTIKEREALYKDGGVFIVTSRILIVDLLNDVVDPGAVGGFLVHHAHRLEEASTEAFILRMYRARNRAGFVKGFSEDPEALVRGFGRAEKALRALHVARLYVWPRFRAEVAEALERVKPDLHEWLQDLTPGMAAVQQAVAVTMDVCLRELRRRAPALDVAELTVENGLFEAFDASLRRQLDPEWHRVRPETRQLVADLSTLRKLLDYLFRYDCVTFYGFLQAVRAASAAGGRGGGGSAPSMWLSMDAADRLFEQAKARVYRVVATDKAAQHGSGGGGGGGGSGGASSNGEPSM
ncbi:hypothetical protein JKP88DRAFT_260432 [Tribonema minus]|uniref:DNA repair endonuclease XPF n=1 Tax=Tribonema minus TaxID=303371 RepID=A0A836CHZ1_9STRA|nr:hypothetical protein JKP88DRAFT_260432 [Tribonema minus]